MVLHQKDTPNKNNFMLTRELYYNGKLVENDGFQVRFRNGMHGRTKVDFEPWTTGILKIYYRREKAKKPYHMYPVGVDLISIEGCHLDHLSLNCSQNTGTGLDFSIEEYYVEVEGLSVSFVEK